MKDEPKIYRAHGQTHVGTSGFANHWAGTKEDVARALAQVFADHPGAVVLDGDDDWYAPGCNRPEKFRHVFGFTPLASFHSKGSGISVSGVVVTREDFERIEREFPSKTWTWLKRERMYPGALHCRTVKTEVSDRRLRDCVRVYEDPTEAV